MRRQTNRKKEEILALLNNFVDSKKSKKQWCLEHEIPVSSLHTWIKKYRTPSEERKVNFIPIKVDTVLPVKESTPTPSNPIVIEIGDIKIHMSAPTSGESIKKVLEAVKSVYVSLS